LHATIHAYLKKHQIGQVFVALLDVVISDSDVVEPDLLYVSRERATDILIPQHVRGAPDLVIEIASKGTRKRDETIKRALYERAGVSEYWVVDPEIDVVRVYRRVGQGFKRPVELRRDAGDTLTTALMPDLQIPLDDVFSS
jgi:Uma2 family endonuclease